MRVSVCVVKMYYLRIDIAVFMLNEFLNEFDRSTKNCSVKCSVLFIFGACFEGCFFVDKQTENFQAYIFITTNKIFI